MATGGGPRTSGIPLVIRIGNDTYHEFLGPGERYSISRAWSSRDPEVAKRKRVSIDEAFPHVTRKLVLWAQNPSIRVYWSNDENLLDESTWEISDDLADPSKRSWADGKVTWVLTFAPPRKTLSPREIQEKELRRAQLVFAEFQKLGPVGKDAVRRWIEDEAKGLVSTPLYRLGNSICSTRPLVVCRTSGEGLTIANEYSLMRDCEHAYSGAEEASLHKAHSEDGIVCPKCGDDYEY